MSVSIHSLHWRIGEQIRSPLIPSADSASEASRWQRDAFWCLHWQIVRTIWVLYSNRFIMQTAGVTRVAAAQMLIALSPSPHDHSLYCVCPAYQLDHHVACCRRDSYWCLLCFTVTDERLYVVATVVDPRYPGRLFGTSKLVCALQLERIARPGRRDNQRNVSAFTTHSRIYHPYLTPVWTSFLHWLINDNWKNSNF